MPWLLLNAHLNPQLPWTLTLTPPSPRSNFDALYHIPSDEEFCLLAKPVFQQRTWENMGINDWIVLMFFLRNSPTWDDLCPLFRILLQLTGEWDRMDNKWWQFCLSLISIGRLDWNKQIPAGSSTFYKIKISLKHFAIWDPCSRECNANAFVWNCYSLALADLYDRILFFWWSGII